MFSLFKKKRPPEELTEFSANFDSEMVRPFLERILDLFESGFGPAQIEEVCRLVATLPHDEEKTLEFQIHYAGKSAPLRIHVFMDDIDSPDIYVYSPAGLSQRIEAEYIRFTQERGM